MSEPPAPCLISLSESAELATPIAKQAGLDEVPLEERRFEGGEFKLRPLQSVRGRVVFVVQTLASDEVPVAERLVRLLFLLSGLRDAGAVRRVAVIPYLAYARKERRTQPRDPVHTRYLAELLETAGADQLLLLDVHNPASVDNALRIPFDHLTALPMMAEHFARSLPDVPLAVGSPDVGGIKRAQVFRELLAARLQRPVELIFAEKRRASGVVSTGGLVGDPAGKHVILIDDLCATGGTLLRAAALCREAGAPAVHAAVTHAPLPTGIEKLLAAESITGIVTTDSVGRSSTRSPEATRKRVILPIAPLLGQALRRMLDGRALAPLLTRWPLLPEE